MAYKQTNKHAILIKITIHEIVNILNIDSSTVSRGLNDSDRVNLKTKKRILEKALELGYRPNLFASNHRHKKSNTLVVVVPRISRYFVSSTIAGICLIHYCRY